MAGSAEGRDHVWGPLQKRLVKGEMPDELALACFVSNSRSLSKVGHPSIKFTRNRNAVTVAVGQGAGSHICLWTFITGAKARRGRRDGSLIESPSIFNSVNSLTAGSRPFQQHQTQDHVCLCCSIRDHTSDCRIWQLRLGMSLVYIYMKSVKR